MGAGGVGNSILRNECSGVEQRPEGSGCPADRSGNHCWWCSGRMIHANPGKIGLSWEQAGSRGEGEVPSWEKGKES